MKIGDEVLVVAKYLPSCCLIGTIIRIESETLTPYVVQFDIDGYIDHDYFQKDELELVP
jgi:hypothetical protein